MRRISVQAAVTAGAIAVVGLTAAAATLSRHLATGPRPDASARPLPAQAIAAGMVVGVDPETGTLGMPEPGQVAQAFSMEEARAYARRIASELVTEHHADGSETLIHDDRLADYTLIRIGPDGKPVFQCVHGEYAAHSAPGRPVQAAPEVK